MIKLEK